MTRMTSRMAVASAVSAAIALSGGAVATAHERPTGVKTSHSRHTSHKAEDRGVKTDDKRSKVEDKKAKAVKALRAKVLREVSKKASATAKVKAWLDRHDLGALDDALVASVAADQQALADHRALVAAATDPGGISTVRRAVMAYHPEQYAPAYSVLAQTKKADARAERYSMLAAFHASALAEVEPSPETTAKRETLTFAENEIVAARDLLATAAAGAQSVRATTSAKATKALLAQARAKNKAAEQRLATAYRALDSLRVEETL